MTSSEAILPILPHMLIAARAFSRFAKKFKLPPRLWGRSGIRTDDSRRQCGIYRRHSQYDGNCGIAKQLLTAADYRHLGRAIKRRTERRMTAADLSVCPGVHTSVARRTLVSGRVAGVGRQGGATRQITLTTVSSSRARARREL